MRTHENLINWFTKTPKKKKKKHNYKHWFLHNFLLASGGERRRTRAPGETVDDGVRVRGSDTTHAPADGDGTPAATDNAVVPYTGEPATEPRQDRYIAGNKFVITVMFTT